DIGHWSLGCSHHAGISVCRGGLLNVGMARTRGSPFPRLDIAVGHDWSDESPHPRIFETTAGGSISPVHSLGNCRTRRQYHYRISLLYGYAWVLCSQHRFSDQDAGSHTCGRKPAVLLLHKRIPNPGRPRTWGRRAPLCKVHCIEFDIPVDRCDRAWPIHTLWRGDVEAGTPTTVHAFYLVFESSSYNEA